MTQAQLSIQEIFSQALEIESEDDRLSFLDQACCGNEKVRRKVDALLAAHAQVGRFMDIAQETELTDEMSDVTESPGTCIGPYKLREQIGEGGFGVVYVAEQEHPVSRKIALKIIKPGMDSRDIIARFEAERQALAMMDHPNVAKVHDAGTTETGRPYFVMELIHGIPITEFCDEQSLTNRERLRLFIDVCRAVQHAHQKGIIHRDLKPSNIMVTMHDDQPIPKVIDFGVAKALSRKLTEKTVYTSYSQMIGTPMYMSPEQAQMSGLDLDTRSDIYSLGVLLYELLTGTTPFDKETIQNAGCDELRRIIREDDPPRPSARVSTLNLEKLSTTADRRKVDVRRLSQSLRGELDWIVMKALDKNRGRRYESASQLAEDIEHYLHDEPVTACPPSLGYRFRKYACRHRVALTTSSLVAISMIVGTIVSVSQAVRASASERAAGEQRNAAVINAEQARESEVIARAERDAAFAAREELRRVLYASQMNLLQVAWNKDNFRRVKQLLAGTRPKTGESDLRGFEWNYWDRQLHGTSEEILLKIPLIESHKVLGSELSPDGAKLAVQYFGNGKVIVVLYDTVSSKELVKINLWPTEEKIQRSPMYFSSDGDYLAIPKGLDPEFAIWDTRTGAKIKRFNTPGRVWKIYVSRQGNRVTYNFGEPSKENRNVWEGGLRVVDIDTESLIYSRDFDPGLWVILQFVSPDAKLIGLSSRPRTRDPQTGALGSGSLEMIDVDSGTVITNRRFNAHHITTSTGRTVQLLSPDGSKVAVRDATAPEVFLILDPKTLTTQGILVGDDKLDERASVVFGHHGRFLVASTSARVYLWSLQDLEMSNVSGEISRIRPLVITNPTLAAPPSSRHSHLRISDDGHRLFSHRGDEVRIWNFPARALKLLNWSHGIVRGGSFNSDGTRAVLLAKRRGKEFNSLSRLLAWDVEADRELWQYEDIQESPRFTEPAFSPEGRFVVVPSFKIIGDPDKPIGDQTVPPIRSKLLVLDGDTGRKIRTIEPENASLIKDPLFNTAGTHLAALVTYRFPDKPDRFEVVLWDIHTGEQVFAVHIDDENPNLNCFSHDGHELMVGQRATGGLLVLDAQTGEKRRIVALEGTGLGKRGQWSLSPDGSTLAVLGLQGQEAEVAVALFDAVTGKPGLKIPVETEVAPTVMTWSPDGRRLALGSGEWPKNPVVTIWDTETGRLLLTLNRFNGQMGRNDRAFRFSSDGSQLLHITSDNRDLTGGNEDSSSHPIHIWDAKPLTKSLQE